MWIGTEDMTMEQLMFFTNIEIALLGTIVFLFLVQLAYYTGIYAKPLRMAKRMNASADSPNGKDMPPVSVIVYAKNESENLKSNLPHILSQTYPNYEVIVINDGSTDESDEVLKKTRERQQTPLSHLYPRKCEVPEP